MERTVTLTLSDNDCRYLSDLAGRNGMTVGALLSVFANDLIDGDSCQGSDEHYRANSWMNRCIFDKDNRFVAYLVDTFQVDDLEELLEFLRIESDPDDLEKMEAEIREIYDGYAQKADMPQRFEDAIQEAKTWLSERAALGID